MRWILGLLFTLGLLYSASMPYYQLHAFNSSAKLPIYLVQGNAGFVYVYYNENSGFTNEIDPSAFLVMYDDFDGSGFDTSKYVSYPSSCSSVNNGYWEVNCDNLDNPLILKNPDTGTDKFTDGIGVIAVVKNGITNSYKFGLKMNNTLVDYGGGIHDEVFQGLMFRNNGVNYSKVSYDADGWTTSSGKENDETPTNNEMVLFALDDYDDSYVGYYDGNEHWIGSEQGSYGSMNGLTLNYNIWFGGMYRFHDTLSTPYWQYDLTSDVGYPFYVDSIYVGRFVKNLNVGLNAVESGTWVKDGKTYTRRLLLEFQPTSRSDVLLVMPGFNYTEVYFEPADNQRLPSQYNPDSDSLEIDTVSGVSDYLIAFDRDLVTDQYFSYGIDNGDDSVFYKRGYNADTSYVRERTPNAQPTYDVRITSAVDSLVFEPLLSDPSLTIIVYGSGGEEYKLVTSQNNDWTYYDHNGGSTTIPVSSLYDRNTFVVNSSGVFLNNQYLDDTNGPFTAFVDGQDYVFYKWEYLQYDTLWLVNNTDYTITYLGSGTINGVNYNNIYQLTLNSPVDGSILINFPYSETAQPDVFTGIYNNTIVIPGEPLPYFLEHDTSGEPTNWSYVWFKTKEPHKQFWVYYGNDSGEAQLPDDVFAFFDDFDGDSIDSGRWSVSANVSVSDSIMTFYNCGGHCSMGALYGGTYSDYALTRMYCAVTQFGNSKIIGGFLRTASVYSCAGFNSPSGGYGFLQSDSLRVANSTPMNPGLSVFEIYTNEINTTVGINNTYQGALNYYGTGKGIGFYSFVRGNYTCDWLFQLNQRLTASYSVGPLETGDWSVNGNVYHYRKLVTFDEWITGAQNMSYTDFGGKYYAIIPADEFVNPSVNESAVDDMIYHWIETDENGNPGRYIWVYLPNATDTYWVYYDGDAEVGSSTEIFDLFTDGSDDSMFQHGVSNGTHVIVNSDSDIYYYINNSDYFVFRMNADFQPSSTATNRLGMIVGTYEGSAYQYGGYYNDSHTNYHTQAGVWYGDNYVEPAHIGYDIIGYHFYDNGASYYDSILTGAPVSMTYRKPEVTAFPSLRVKNDGTSHLDVNWLFISQDPVVNYKQITYGPEETGYYNLYNHTYTKRRQINLTHAADKLEHIEYRYFNSTNIVISYPHEPVTIVNVTFQHDEPDSNRETNSSRFYLNITHNNAIIGSFAQVYIYNTRYNMTYDGRVSSGNYSTEMYHVDIVHRLADSDPETVQFYYIGNYTLTSGVIVNFNVSDTIDIYYNWNVTPHCPSVVPEQSYFTVSTDVVPYYSPNGASRNVLHEFNGNNYTTTVSGNTFTSTLVSPDVDTNTTFPVTAWFIPTFMNDTKYRPYNCATLVTVYGITIVPMCNDTHGWITFRTLLINDSPIISHQWHNFTVLLPAGQESIVANYTNVYNVTFCIYPKGVYNVSDDIFYYNWLVMSGRWDTYYLRNAEYNFSEDNYVNLYLINGTELFDIKVIYSNGQVVPWVFVELVQFLPDENVSKTVGICQTDNQGKCRMFYDQRQPYLFRVFDEDGNVLYAETDFLKYITTTGITYKTIIIGENIPLINDTFYSNCSVEYINETSCISCSFGRNDGQQGNWYLNLTSNFTGQLINYSTVYTSSGSMTVCTTENIGEYHLYYEDVLVNWGVWVNNLAMSLPITFLMLPLLLLVVVISAYTPVIGVIGSGLLFGLSVAQGWLTGFTGLALISVTVFSWIMLLSHLRR